MAKSSVFLLLFLFLRALAAMNPDPVQEDTQPLRTSSAEHEIAEKPLQLPAAATNLDATFRHHPPKTGLQTTALSFTDKENVNPSPTVPRLKPRGLLQSADDASNIEEYTCSLTDAQIASYFDEQTKSWRVGDDALDALDNDLQSVVNCMTDGSVLLLDVAHPIRPSSRITLPRPLTISGYVKNATVMEGTFPRARKKAVFACPSDDIGVFHIRAPGVTLANLQFRKCNFSVGSERKSIVEVEGCSFGKTRRPGVVALYHVRFSRNRLSDAVGIRSTRDSCSDLEMTDVIFADNVCSGSICGAFMSSHNRLTNCTFEGNRRMEGTDQSPVMLYAPSGSTTSAKSIRAENNHVEIIHVDGGSLKLKTSHVEHNLVLHGETFHSRAACIHLTNRSNGTISDCTFRNNEGREGTVVHAEESDVLMRNSLFQSNKADRGGALYLGPDSSASISDCRFAFNFAESQGGAVYVTDKATCSLIDCRFRNNSADHHGGAGYFAAEASGHFTDVNLSGNFAKKQGGSLYLRNSTVWVDRCDFSLGKAERGGFVYARDNSTVDVRDSNFEDAEGEDGGGCLWSLEGHLKLNRSSLRSCSSQREGGAMFLQRTSTDLSDVNVSFARAIEDGGGIYAANASIDGESVTMTDNESEDAGGAIHLQEKTLLTLRNASFKQNKARSGGAVYARKNSEGNFADVHFADNLATENGGSLRFYASVVNFTECTFTNGSAQNGGFIAIRDNATVSISDSMIQNATANDGGCLYAHDGNFAVRNVTLRGCHSEVDGAGMRLVNAVVDLYNITMTLNRADDDGACLFAEYSNITGDRLVAQYNSAGDHGGVIFVRFLSFLTLSNSVLRNNSADSGGTIFQEPNSTAYYTNVSFLNSAAVVEAGIIHVERSVAHFDRCTFAAGTAEEGGFIYSRKNSSVVIRETKMQNGEAIQGGCLSVIDGPLSLQDSTLQDCHSTENGGAMLLINVTASVSNLTVVANRADGNGGGILAERTRFSGNGMIADGNAATGVGGALYFEKSTFDLVRSRFQNNTGVRGGAVYQTVWTNGSIVEGRFDNNTSTDSGGTFFLSNSELNVTRSEFNNGTASSNGGFFSLVSMSDLSVEETRMGRGRAANGGAMAVLESSFRGRRIRVMGCSAGNSGGALNGNESSSIWCAECTFAENSADARGGALAFDSRDRLRHDVLLQNCTFHGNRARNGGGLHIADRAHLLDCADSQSNCTTVALFDTIFTNNRADVAGGAVFVSSVKNIHVNCLPTPRQKNKTVSTPWQSSDRLNLSAIHCPTWKENSAALYGDDVGSYASRIRRELFKKEEQNVTVEGENRYIVYGHRSGTALPMISMQAVDELGQGPAIGATDLTVFADMTSPDGFFPGSIRVPLNESGGNITAVGFAPPNTYLVLVNFTETNFEGFQIVVHVKRCVIGEIASGNGTFCEQCSPATYTFAPYEKECHPCPENGKCESRVIWPEKGYWHASPCSTHLAKCVLTDACDFEGRNQALSEATKAIENCTLDPAFAANYTKAQCKEGHEGPLCASCAPGYGTSHNNACVKCTTEAGSVFMVMASLVILLGMASFTVRGTSVSTDGLSATRQRRRVRKQLDRSSGMVLRRMPTHIELGMMLSLSREARGTPSASQLIDNVEDVEDDAELCKWKVVDLFKIMVNYMQVIATAVALSVDWSKTLRGFFKSAEFLGAVTTETVRRSVDCLVSEEASIKRVLVSALVRLALPLAAMLFFAVFWAVMAMRKAGERQSFFVRKVILSVFAVCYISFLSITRTLVSFLNCVNVYASPNTEEDSVSQFWAADTDIECYKGTHGLITFAVGIPYFACFTIGFPAIAAFLVLRYARNPRGREWIFEVAGFLHRSYKKQFVLWESLVMFRKAILVSVVVFSYPLGVYLQHVLIILILVVALYFHTALCPYREEFEDLNRIEALSQLITLMTFVSSLFFADDQVSNNGVRMLITALVLAGNVSFFAFCCLYFAAIGSQYLRAVLHLEGVEYDQNRGPWHIYQCYIVRYLFSKAKEWLTPSHDPTPAASNTYLNDNRSEV